MLKATPNSADYRRLRKETGLSPKTKEAAEAGLRGTIFAVQVLYGGEVIGMGRLIGDGGCHFQIVDMAVLPQHQGKGIGSAIMEELNRYIDQQLPPSAYISLIADGDAHHLYRKFGFDDVAPASRGMYRRVLSDLQ
ncbi:MAG: GNAT family N-acetyltransferase [Balneolaceae bacterium]|nr:GNAT family N-acetyltransferase [Balneolaceae bacterium]